MNPQVTMILWPLGRLICILAVFNIYIYSYSIILPYVNYMWQQTPDLNFYKVIITNGIVIVFYALISRLRGLYRTAYLIMLLFILMPCAAVYANLEVNFLDFFVIYFSLLSGVTIAYILGMLKLPPIKINAKFSSNVFIILPILTVAYILIAHFDQINPFLIFNLDQLYLFRGENSMSTFEGYLTRFSTSILVPTCIYLYFSTKRSWLLLLGFLISFLNFSVFGMKIQLLIYFLFIYLSFMKLKYQKTDLFSLISFLILVFLISFLAKPVGLHLLDRFLFLPALLNIIYIDFFSTHQLNWFEGSKLEIFFGGSNYREDVGFVIDNYFFGGGMNANTGFIASLYAEIGFVGLIVSTLVFNFLILATTEIEKRASGLGYLLCISLSFEIINAPITNTLLSNMFILIFLFPLFLKKT